MTLCLTFVRCCRRVACLCCLCSTLWLCFGQAQVGNAAPPGVTDGTQVKTIRPLLQGKKLALLIGINQYQDPHWYPLRYAARDATRFRSTLTQGGFQHPTLLHTSTNTTLASIKQSLARLKQQNTSPQDTIVIYISAHGTLVGDMKRQQRYIITSDTDDENITGTGLSVAWLRAHLKGFLSRRKALILATCYTGKPNSKSRHPRGQKGITLTNPMPHSTTMLILNAASYQYSAYESKKLKADVYTHFLLTCIQRFAHRSSQKNHVTALQAHSCAVKQTYRYVMRFRGVRQLPGLEADVTGLEAVYLFGQPQQHQQQGESQRPSSTLTNKGSQAYVQVPYTLLRRYIVLVSRDYGASATRATPSHTFEHEGDTLASLAPGRYQVQFRARTGTQRYDTTLQLQSGQRVMLHLPKPNETHKLSLSVGFAQGGPLLLESRFLSLGLVYRHSIWGLGLRWDGLGQPEGTGFSLARIGVRGELNWPIQLISTLLCTVGTFVLPGSLIRTSATGQRSYSFFLNTGITAGLTWQFSQSLGLQFAADIGIDMTPTAQSEQSLSLYWRAYSAITYAF